MKIILISFFLFLSASYSFPQSVHKFFRDKLRNEEKVPRFSQKIVIPEPDGNASKLSKTVFGFLPDWEYVLDSKKYLRLDLLTHVAVFGFVADANGNLSQPLAWPWNDVIEAAHAAGVKVVMTVISFDNEVSHTLLTNSASQSNLFSNIASVVSQNNLDGVNLDFEGLYEDDRGSALNGFVSSLKSYLSADLELSFDSPAWNWGGWDFEGLAEACDYLFVMEYDYFGAWSDLSGPSAPLTGNGISVFRSINEQYANVQNDKLVLGVPYYGVHWITVNDEENSNTTNFLDYLRYRNIKTGYDWNNVRWSENYSTPWFAWQEDSVHQIWFDDVKSLEAKYDFAIDNNLKGIGIWALGFDGNRKELWSVIEEKFAGAENTVPEPPVAFSVEGAEYNGGNFAKLTFSACENADFYWVYESDDGVNFDSLATNDTSFLIGRDDLTSGLNTKYYKVAAANSAGISAYSDLLAVNFTPQVSEAAPFLIVNGFDRYYGNDNNSDYIKRIAEMFDALGIPYCSVNNEAVIRGFAPQYSNVYWILGNESRVTETLNYFEQNFLKEIIDNAASSPRLFISGSEIGYDLSAADFSREFDEEFYSDYLHAEYISDAPANYASTYYSVENIAQSIVDYGGIFNFDNGTHGAFDVAYPDAISSSVADSLNDLSFVGLAEGHGYAGISYNDGWYKSVYFSFPLETVYGEEERFQLLSKAMDFLTEGITAVEDENEILPAKFELMQNYPNPFNPTTTIKYTIPSLGGVETLHATSLRIYNVLGEEIATLVNKNQSPGNYSVQFNASDLPSGVYFYTLRFGNSVLTKKMILLK